MPLDPTLKAQNLTIKNYPSGHMIYLNDASRTALKGDLANFYDGISPTARRCSALKLQMRTQQLGSRSCSSKGSSAAGGSRRLT